MHTLHLDLHLKFVPPMSEHGPGIVLTRSIELPFVPESSIRLYGTSIDQCPDPLGFSLDDLTWDIDREVFLASTSLISHDEPLAFILDTIREWIGLGWSIGSYHDTYGEPDEDNSEPEAVRVDDGAYEHLEQLHTMPKTRRSREFNQFFKALIRVMAETYDNRDIAYAMDKLGRLVAEEEAGPDESKISLRWRDARNEFLQMSQDQQFAWVESLSQYPSIERAVLKQTGPKAPGRAESISNE
tara:strand:+ start:285 stop:1010 length:726 start_codon:yes stop_codon:yes gene_type:complete